MNRIDNIDKALNLLKAEVGTNTPTPNTLPEKQRMMRALMNVWQPSAPSEALLEAQDAELSLQREEKGVVTFEETGMLLWKGDITRLKVDAIVNATNSQMLGCFVPLHSCIDNAIHSAAGIQLRWACHELMQRQGNEEKTGQAKLTPGFNLPASYVIHTGPHHCQRHTHRKTTGRAGQLLSRLPRRGRNACAKKHRFLLYLNGCVPLSATVGCRNSR